MNVENNVISLEHSFILHTENAIIDALSNRGGKWVGQHVVFDAGNSTKIPNLNIVMVVNQMVESGLLEKSFQVIKDKLGRPLQLPLYRLAPKPW